jgi:hypothetical protein
MERGKRGELTRDKVKGAIVYKAGSKIPTWLQSINSINTSKDDIKGLVSL